MQIKDLSVKAERLDEVRGGIYSGGSTGGSTGGDVNTAVAGSNIAANQQVNVGGFGSVQTNSPTYTTQQIDGSVHATIATDVSESFSLSNMFTANGSSFFSGGYWG